MSNLLVCSYYIMEDKIEIKIYYNKENIDFDSMTEEFDDKMNYLINNEEEIVKELNKDKKS